MSADDSFPMDQISSLFPQLENIQLVGAKGPQQIFTATLKSNFAPVMLRVVPTEEAGIFGWDPEFIVRSLTIVEQSHQGLLRVYEVGQAGPFTFIISEHPPYPRMADMENLPQISPQAALNLVRNMAEGLLTLHRKNIFHGGITPKLICLREDGGDALLLPINIYPAQPPVDMGDFASPEWVTGAETTFTPGMDIYALGLALYILLTRKTPMEAGFAMPSSLIKCSDAVDSAVSRAINPDTRERYRDLGDFITDLDKAIANPSGRNAASIPPPSSSPAIPALNMQKGQSNIYYYLIPALIVGIVLTYTCILYKKDVVRMRNDYNEQVQKENNAKAEAARQANRDARRHAPATAQNAAAAIPSPVPAARPAQTPAVPKVSAEPGKINWSLQPGVKVRQSSNRNMLGAYGPKKAVDGNTSSRISDVSISATGVVEGKTAWFGIDFGRETNRTIEKVVIYTPANLTLLGTMEKFKVILYGNDKNVLAEKTFSTTPSEKSTNVTSWKLGRSSQGARLARGIRKSLPAPGVDGSGSVRTGRCGGHTGSRTCGVIIIRAALHPLAPPPGAMLKTPFPFPLPEIRLGQGLMECHALSSGFGFAYEIFRFLLHSPEAIQARTEENPKNVFAPDRKQPPLSTFPTPEKRSHPHMAPGEIS